MSVCSPLLILGGYEPQWNGTDFNDAPKGVVFLVQTSDQIINSPYTESGVVALRGHLFTYSSVGYTFQLYVECANGTHHGFMYKRTTSGGTWSNWEQIQTA